MPQLKIPHVTTKTQCSRINKIKNIKKTKKNYRLTGVGAVGVGW